MIFLLLALQQQAPPAPVVPPDEAVKTFTIAAGFRVELVAAEPLVQRPVAIAFDPDGRLWAVEMRGFMPNPDGKGEEDPVGQVVVLEDADGDGRMDRSTVFLDGLVMPRALALVEDGLLVGEPPKLWFCRDTDGDLKCDEKTVVASDYGGRGNPEHTANGLLRAVDNWIYNANTGARFRRADGKWIRGATRSRGQWGLTQDDLGRLFYNSNSDQLRGDLVPIYAPGAHASKGPGVNLQIARDQSVWPVRVTPGVNRGYQNLNKQGRISGVTAACGPAIYRGDNFPEEFRGNAFVCEPAANLVKRNVLIESSTAITAKNPYDKSEFLASTDERFRPVNLTTGPDGCLYVVDLYHGILQHKKFLTPYLRAQIAARGLDQPLGLGRIYRVVHESRPPGKKPALSKASAAELVAHLSHPNGWWRDTAQRLLVERRDPAVEPALRALATSGLRMLPRLHALFTLDGMGALDDATLTKILADRDPRLQSAARALNDILHPSPFAALLQSVTAKPEIDVKALAGREVDFLEELLELEGWMTVKPGRERLLGSLAANARSGDLARLLYMISIQPVEAAWRAKALLEGIARPAEEVRLDAVPVGLIKLCRAEDADARARARSIAQWVSWPGKEARHIEAPPAAPLTVDQRARFERGKKQFAVSCAVCHGPAGLGEPGKGPPLVDSEWVLGSEERLARILLHGLRGPLTVGGKIYETIEMPAVLTMSNAEIAEALTYVRREWGHQAEPVEPATIKRIRDATDAREEPWTEKELLLVK